MLALASLLFPGAHVIYVMRDPLDVCFSWFARPLEPRLHSYASDLREVGLRYRQFRRLMEHWQAVLDLSMLTIEYEKLVADQQGVTRRVIEFCGLPWDDRCLRYHETESAVHTVSYDQVRRPIYSTAVGRAGPFEKHLGPLREALEGM